MENKGSNLEDKQTSDSSQVQSRRKFLTKVGTGALIVSLPSKAVWATNGGIGGLTGSVVASGNSSDFAGGNALKLQRPWYWIQHKDKISSSILNTRFKDLFGGNAWKENGDFLGSHKTVANILFGTSSNTFAYQGPNNINRLIVSSYLSAIYTNSAMFDVHFPVVGMNKPYSSNSQLAHALYAMGAKNPWATATQLGQLHDNPSSVTV